MSRPTNFFATWIPRSWIAALVAAALSLGFAPRVEAALVDGIHNIQHVVVIMQENRSFDQYFGTYPGANGIHSVIRAAGPDGQDVKPPGLGAPDAHRYFGSMRGLIARRATALA